MKRSLTICVQLTAIGLGICLTATETYGATNTDIVSSALELSIPVAKDIVNILFFVTIGILGILSYLQARKTLFTPIKTETFKLQLKTFEELLLYFENLRLLQNS